MEMKVKQWQYLYQTNTLKIRGYYKRQGRKLRNQGINPRRRYNNCKHVCTQIVAPQYKKANATDHKRENQE